jgi:hypothetical protein
MHGDLHDRCVVLSDLLAVRRAFCSNAHSHRVDQFTISTADIAAPAIQVHTANNIDGEVGA